MADLKNTKTPTNTSTGRKPLSSRTNTAPASAQVRTSRSTSLHTERKSKSRDGSKCPSPTKAEEKRIPPIKAPVGLAKGPDLKNVRSKVGSFQNVKHVPAGGEKKLVTQKLEWKATSKIGSLDYAKHKPGGGDVKVETRKLDWKVNSKVGSLDNVKHRPGGGAIKIFNERYGSSRSSSEIRAPNSTCSPSPPGSSTPNGKHESRKNSLETKTKLPPNQTKSSNANKAISNENAGNKVPITNGNCTEQLLGNVQSSLSQLVIENRKTTSSAPIADLLA